MIDLKKNEEALKDAGKMENFNKNDEDCKNNTEESCQSDYVKSPYKYPRHITDIVMLLKNNFDLRMFCSYAIFAILERNFGWHFNSENGRNYKYVKYLWNKFIIVTDGLNHEYRYTEPFFIQAYLSAYMALANRAQDYLDRFFQKEQIDVNSFNHDDMFIGELAGKSGEMRTNDEYLRCTWHLAKNKAEESTK